MIIILNICIICLTSLILFTYVIVSLSNRQYQHELWLRREMIAQATFLAKKDRQEKERMRQEEEEVHY